VDEAAFLDALRINPADDANRLVYADWLSDHGEELRAEYLRLVVQLRHAQARLPVLGQQLDPAWVMAANGRYSVVLRSYSLNHKINVIKIIREITGMGLKEAKDLSESLPAVIKDDLTLEVAELIRDKFSPWANVSLEPPIAPAPAP
jgi:uncharacterized protein (TIGR02996 family)